MTSIRDAIKQWEATEGAVAAEAEDIRLCPIALSEPCITKMDGALGSLKKVKHLRLSTNDIRAISGLSGMDSLEILSLGRNGLKNVAGLDPVSETLEQLWVSYNKITNFNGIERCQRLTTIYASNNMISKWSEVERLAALPKLKDLLLAGNPICTKEPELYRVEVIKRLPNLKTLDGEMVEDTEREEAANL